MKKETGKQETIEEMQGIVAQRQFKTLDAFVKEQNNFFAHFWIGNSFAESKRAESHFQRFKMMYPKLERELTERVTEVRKREGEDLPYESLYKAYELMSQLVFASDERVKEYAYKDYYLIS